MDLKLQHKVLHLNDIHGAKQVFPLQLQQNQYLHKKMIDGAKMIFTADYTVAQ